MKRRLFHSLEQGTIQGCNGGPSHVADVSESLAQHSPIFSWRKQGIQFTHWLQSEYVLSHDEDKWWKQGFLKLTTTNPGFLRYNQNHEPIFSIVQWRGQCKSKNFVVFI
jgi:hypothetical protein